MLIMLLLLGFAPPAARASDRTAIWPGTSQQGVGLVLPVEENTPPPVFSISPPSPPTASVEPAAAASDAVRTVFFDANSAQIPENASPAIRYMAEKLRDDRHLYVRLVPGNDVQASREYCVALAERRMDILEAALVQAGVRPGQIRPQASHCEHPMQSDCSAKSCFDSRRLVEMRLMP